ncbi:hypothetical protein [Nostoc sp. NMS8]|uniref:hypothetical protein n=1 Tax=Nostoc sp. NMS8 TaxID=2815392 RepID=UPI0025D8D57A|nr:hypothetical protein [Nostoc sp. NMS8]MBN3957846.1 hypothetical protein [Nostoc sp. NMS8]
MSQDVTDFELCRKLIYQIVEFSLKRRNELFVEGKIDKVQYIAIRQKIEEPLRREAKDLTIKISGNIFKDMSVYKDQIDIVTGNLKQVIAQIQDYNNSINFFTRVINFFGSILSAASSGIAGIPNLLINLQAIL